MEKLVGKKINKVFISEEYLKFETDKGDVCYRVDGDCCSHSYFYDFQNVNRLIKNGKVISTEKFLLILLRGSIAI